MEAQFDTGATHDTRIFTGCWALAGNAPPRLITVNAASTILGACFISSSLDGYKLAFNIIRPCSAPAPPGARL